MHALLNQTFCPVGLRKKLDCKLIFRREFLNASLGVSVCTQPKEHYKLFSNVTAKLAIKMI